MFTRTNVTALVLILFASTFLVFQSPSGAQQSQQAAQWEYAIDVDPSTFHEILLNRRGMEGWELVAVKFGTVGASSPGGQESKFIFKRPKR